MPLTDQYGRPISSRPQAPGGDAIRVRPEGMPGLRHPSTQPPTGDSFQNFMASVGIGTPNLSSGSTYGFNPITRERTLLEWMYRSSWICGVCVDAVADDAVKMGIDWGGQIPPDVGEELTKEFTRFGVWGQINALIKWGRLYGGAIGVIEIAGQDPMTPLRLETIGKGSYAGLTAMDRWMVEPTLNDLITQRESVTEKGLPRYYRVTADAPAYPRQTVHYTRVIRYEGFDLPYWQKIAENLWGMSIFERFYDRLVAFDSATQGVAQLIYKAYLRWVKIKNLRMMITTGGEDMQRVLNQINMMRFFQTNEGISLLDADDDFGTQTYSFEGLDTALLQFGQQLSGALQIPLVRLFGQSPAGLNSTGESDLRTYYDAVHQMQELKLRRPIELIINIIAKSGGIALPENFTWEFESLWQMQPSEKASMADVVTRTVLSAEETGVIGKKRALEELRQSADQTGIWSTLTDEEIKQAEEDDLQASQGEDMGMGGMMGEAPPPGGGQPGHQGAPVLRAMPGGRPGPGQGPAGQGGQPPPGTPGTARRELPVPIPRPHLGTGGVSGGSTSGS